VSPLSDTLKQSAERVGQIKETVEAVVEALSQNAQYQQLFPALESEGVRRLLSSRICTFEAGSGVGKAGLGSILSRDSRYGLQDTPRDIVFEIAKKILKKLKSLIPDFNYVPDLPMKKRRFD
jgi:hypothetical protein